MLVVASLAATAVVAWDHGYRLYVVHTGSMVPTLRPGYAIIDGPAPRALHPGEMITFRYNSGPDRVITHRLVSDNAGVIRTKGDANKSPDPWKLSASQVAGTPVMVLPALGYLLVYLRQPTGAASMVTFVLMIMLLWDLCFAANDPEGRRASRPRKRPLHASAPS